MNGRVQRAAIQGMGISARTYPAINGTPLLLRKQWDGRPHPQPHGAPSQERQAAESGEPRMFRKRWGHAAPRSVEVG